MAVADLERELGRDLSTDIEQKYAETAAWVSENPLATTPDAD